MKETKLIKGVDWTIRSEGKGVQMRIFDSDRPGYVENITSINLKIEDMKLLRDFLDKRIEAVEAEAN